MVKETKNSYNFYWRLERERELRMAINVGTEL